MTTRRAKTTAKATATANAEGAKDPKGRKSPAGEAESGGDAEVRGGAVAEFSATVFRNRLNAWYRTNARVLPWRGTTDPYAIWLSEIMLQQTRVAAVIERYKEFLARFPTLPALAAAEEDAVLALWSGLGYYRRARMLHRGAQFVVQELGGVLPSASFELRSLPGVGEYTAAAIASIAFGESVAVLDGNVERVLLRVLGEPEGMSKTKLLAVAQSLVPAKVRKTKGASGAGPEHDDETVMISTPAGKERLPGTPVGPPTKTKEAITPGEHNQAMMELGATVCLPKSPLCLQCPVMEMCRTRGEHLALPAKKMQSREAAYLLALRKHGTATEVLVERRAAEASLMAGMLELPPLPMEAVEGRQPVLRVRHSITNTNYYVQVFSESAPGLKGDDELEAEVDEEDAALLVVAEPDVSDAGASLLGQVPAAPESLEWVTQSMLAFLPLTGLARKVLQRLGVMAVEKVLVGEKMLP